MEKTTSWTKVEFRKTSAQLLNQLLNLQYEITAIELSIENIHLSNFLGFRKTRTEFSCIIRKIWCWADLCKFPLVEIPLAKIELNTPFAKWYAVPMELAAEREAPVVIYFDVKVVAYVCLCV